MNIALVIKRFSRTGGGGERYAFDLALGLAGRGHSVWVYAAKFDGDLDVSRISTVLVPMRDRPSLLRQWNFNQGLRTVLDPSRHDVVYALTECYPCDAIRLGGGLHEAWLGYKHPRGGLFLLLEGLRLRNVLRRLLERRIFSVDGCRRMVFNSNLCREQAWRLHGTPPGRTELIYNGKEAAFTPDRHKAERQRLRTARGVDDQTVVYLFVANNFGRKGLGLLLHAAAGMEPALAAYSRIWVVGSAKRERLRFQMLARRLGIAGRVDFCGPQEDTAPWYAAADALVLPTRYDPFANVCLEAMCEGLPVVTTAANGAAELIEDGVNGYVAGDVAGITRAMERLADAAHRREAGLRAQATAAAYSPARCLDRTEKLLEGIVRERRQWETHEQRTSGFRMFWTGRHHAALIDHGLREFKDYWSVPGGRVEKHNAKRRVRRLEDPALPFYAKEHHPVEADEALKMLVRAEYPFRQGLREWKNLMLMHRLGIPSAMPACCGLETRWNGRSFIWMEDIGPSRRLEEVLSSDRAADRAVRRAWVEEAAVLVGALHGAGYVHKDLYLGHLFVLDSGPAGDDIVLLDVQRVARMGLLRWHWKVKDLAALYFSSRNTRLSRADRLRFYLRYAHVSRLREIDRLWIRCLVRKAARMGLHTEKLLARRRVAARPGANGGMNP